jgi:hypothetical protein
MRMTTLERAIGGDVHFFVVRLRLFSECFRRRRVLRIAFYDA